MEQPPWFVETVERMKKEFFSPSADHFALRPVSTYETAWVAMVPDSDDSTRPMFPKYLDWILRSQNALGVWFEDHVRGQQVGLDLDHHELINYKHQWSRADLMATLACLVALKTWEITGFSYKINKGLKFLEDNIEELMMRMKMNKKDGDEAGFQKWFLMVELVKAKGLKINNGLLVGYKQNGIKFKREEDETIERVIMREIAFENCNNSEHFRSPSATACAFMITGNEAYKTYLQHLASDCHKGVPPIYVVDKDIIKLCIVDHLERLGCAEHFTEGISDMMDHQYRKWMAEESKFSKKDDIAFQIYKDSLAFRLLRMHGYEVSPRRFCWFIDDEKLLSYMKHNHALFLGPMLSIYKASHIAFPKDYELDKAGVFARHILQMGIMGTKSQNKTDISVTSTRFVQEIEHELEHKWLARMDHLEHRLYIERGGVYLFHIGNKAPCRILQNEDLLQLAVENFMTRQLVYKKELNELHRWSKDSGLSTMGFGREKTSYCYFAMASSICLPLNIYSRVEAVKCAILITITDDFFDEEGSLHELSILTTAVQRWEGDCLTSHSKAIFSALNNLVHDISLKSFKRHGRDLKKILQDAWKEIFKSWLKEAEWRKTSHPSIDQYIEISKRSIAVDIIILAACYLTNLNVAIEECYWDLSNTMITKSLMISCRLLNDLESYKKEAKVGKPNTVLLYLKENPGAKIDDAFAFVRNILEKKKKELLRQVMSRNSAESNMPREWKLLHLSCLKVFQMFFNSMNAFDSPTVLVQSINKAIYEPLMMKETTRQSNNFISKEFKHVKPKVSSKKLKIDRARKKSALWSFDLNKWLYPRTDKKLLKPSFACSFMACNTISNTNMLWK